MSWQEQIKNSYTSIDQLPDNIYSEKEKKKLREIIRRHPMRITPYYYGLINPADRNDPIGRMALPHLGELVREGAYDTSGEAQSTVLEGVQHKYASTVLLLSNNRCAMYCRHCFRKRMVGLSQKEVLQRVDLAVEYIKKDSRINNILITGGDPLMLETRMLKALLDKLVEIEQLRFIRIGSRIPVTLPSRIYEDKKLLELLSFYNSDNTRIYLVTHYNHPREMTEESSRAISSLLKAGVVSSNQGVLLKGVNDNPEVLIELMQLLVQNGVQPYYIFQCRPVRGVKRYFQVPLVRGIEIIDSARKGLDGISKRFRFIMSTKVGKLEVIGKIDDLILVKHHQARNPVNFNKIYKLKSNDYGAWIDEFEKIK